MDTGYPVIVAVPFTRPHSGIAASDSVPVIAVPEYLIWS